MKTLTLALFAATLAVAPAAFAADEPAGNVPAAAQAAPNKTSISKDWQLGDRVPSGYVSTNNYQADIAALNLPTAPNDYRWIHVADNAYLVSETTDKIRKIVGVPARQK